MVEFCETPIDESQLSVFVVDHHVVRLHVAMHDAHAVAVVESLQQLVQVKPNVVVSQSLETIKTIC